MGRVDERRHTAVLSDRKSISEMKEDHEEQVRRLKRLKDEEIDAVTSATAQTRSLTVVMEQMEQFSSRLGDLSSRVESSHENTTHGLERGAKHRDEQLRMMQERLAQQQTATEEERSRLKEIVSRMDTQLHEQQRQLEKVKGQLKEHLRMLQQKQERWKMAAEQAKAESTQRGLEGERHALSLQVTMEREELERAKSALLEEQKSVMQHCAEERRKLAADWAHFHSLEKQRHERAEREAGSLLERREGSILSLAQKHAEGEAALREAKRVEAEHRARLGSVHAQTERLRQQEQRLLQVRPSLGTLCRSGESARCITRPVWLQTRLSHLQEDTGRRSRSALMTSLPQVLTSASPDAGSALTYPEPSVSPPAASLASSQAMALQASLALWKYTAEKDREYLREEQIFLENLKKNSHRAASSREAPSWC
ncbi:Fas-binding factor 1 [Liparis tanakae]|uniref:Fas-binding factor 1 n=1 Tax=Liparis tanakae TaxID=230148 RepID=A0A4Z2F8M8_9TELE|nr:Fas-binding factor 1 [Liparis tanakae]